MTSPLVELFKHNLWANLRVLDTCSNLTDEHLDTVSPGTYGNILDTLLHVVGAEESYVARLTGQPRPPARTREDFSGFDDLRAAATRSGEALIHLAEHGASMEIYRGTMRDGTPIEVASAILFAQAINHATEHRSHINTILTHLGTEPCYVDGWAYGESTGQVKTG